MWRGRIRFSASDIHARCTNSDAEGSQRVSRSFGHVSFWLSWRQAYHGLFQLSVSIGRSSRRTIDGNRDNDNDDGVWEAYNIICKGT